ncbi:MAG: peptidylprolyl isomerase, partial [Clostridia bacterium]|nr:peptidylprolyl isomerase [Clostridia bacterium]
KQNGKTQMDETGKVATDILGAPEYYTEDGRIAYDKQNGVIGYVYEKDDKGNYTENKVIQNYDDKTKAELEKTAKEYAEVCNGHPEKFAEYVKEYGTEDTSGEMYLFASAGYYASLNASAAYFDDIAEALAEMKAGECRVIKSSYGYHVISKRENKEAAYEDEALKESFFADFSDNLIGYLWARLCSEYLDEVKTDYAVLSEAPDMRRVAANVLY